MDNGTTSEAVFKQGTERKEKINVQVCRYNLRPGASGLVVLRESRATPWNISTEIQMYRSVAEVPQDKHVMRYSESELYSVI
jgi:hypothetical protein